MKLQYSPTYSVLYRCEGDLVTALSNILGHSLEEDTLLPFIKTIGKEFPFTKKYAFKAILNEDDGTYNLKFYSGYVRTVLEFLKANKIKPIIESLTDKYTCTDTNVSDVLRDHQKKIVTVCLSKKRGIIKSPTGSGKSYAIAELVRKLNNEGLKVLVTVPTISLQNQLTDDINNFRKLHGCELLDIGAVGGGKYKFKDVTVGIPNSLSKLDKTKDYLESVDVLIADEVHTCCNATYALMLTSMTNRRISLGLSATPGCSIFLQGFFGDPILEIKEAEMIEKDIIMQPLFEFWPAPKAFIAKSLGEYASNIQNLTDAHRYKVLSNTYNSVIINNQGRNKLIVNKAINCIENVSLGPVLIIVNKVKGEYSHADILVDLFKEKGYTLPVISGYISKKKKEKLINDLKESKIVGAIAGPKVLSAGISIPSLSTIILAGAGRSDSEFIQRVGRILRKKEGKDRPLVIDFKDPQYWFASQSRSRILTAEQIYGSDNIIIK